MCEKVYSRLVSFHRFIYVLFFFVPIHCWRFLQLVATSGAITVTKLAPSRLERGRREADRRQPREAQLKR